MKKASMTHATDMSYLVISFAYFCINKNGSCFLHSLFSSFHMQSLSEISSLIID